jgi:glycosyltransferase involved in cell wall biosynthesis
VPVVSFDCPYGPGEIIRHEVDGLLVPAADVGALAAAIDRMLSDARLRAVCGQHARTVVERFSIERVMQRWGTVIQAATSGAAAN